MYIENIKNQVLDSKKLIQPVIFPKETRFDTVFGGDVHVYLNSLTKKFRAIAEYLLQFSYKKKWGKLNAIIAQETHSSKSTVLRATNLFHADGFILKTQKQKFDYNFYTFNPRIPKRYIPHVTWLNSLSPENQDLYITNGIYINEKKEPVYSLRNDARSNYSWVLDNNYKKLVTGKTRARARGNTSFVKKVNKKWEKLAVFTQVQKEWVNKYKRNPKMKEILYSPQVKPHFITPEIEELTEFAKLDDATQLKLVVHPDAALQFVLSSIHQDQIDKKTIKTRAGWLMAMLTKFCRDNKLQPDWPLYYSLCEITGVVNVTREMAGPKIVQNDFPKESFNRNHSPMVELKTNPVEVEIEACIKNIEKTEDRIKNPEKYYKPEEISPFMIDLLVISLESFKKDLVRYQKQIH